MKNPFSTSPKSLDAILSGFNKTIEQLDNLITQNNAASMAKSEEIARLEKEQDEAMREAYQAERVLNNIRSLIQ